MYVTCNRNSFHSHLIPNQRSAPHILKRYKSHWVITFAFILPNYKLQRCSTSLALLLFLHLLHLFALPMLPRLKAEISVRAISTSTNELTSHVFSGAPFYGEVWNCFPSSWLSMNANVTVPGSSLQSVSLHFNLSERSLIRIGVPRSHWWNFQMLQYLPLCPPKYALPPLSIIYGLSMAASPRGYWVKHSLAGCM